MEKNITVIGIGRLGLGFALKLENKGFNICGVDTNQNYIDSLWNIAPEVRRSSHTYIPYFNIMSKYIPNITELKDSDPEWWFECRDIFCDKK